MVAGEGATETWEFGGVMELFCILILVLVMHFSVFVKVLKTIQREHFPVCKLYLNAGGEVWGGEGPGTQRTHQLKKERKRVCGRQVLACSLENTAFLASLSELWKARLGKDGPCPDS